ncbi:MAG TPA: flagellar hook-basal body complex protein FliE [Desulfocapsa sulfexigens]|nr:flagellar hook-basal body complex protein FliE [Desulfocapsa sulfexigens]HIQ37127.1 flagellar hook-basal body complex protein FliE [Desulfocapsa sulfexigens]
MNPILNNITGLKPLPLKPADTNPIARAGSDFYQMIKANINQVAKAESHGGKAIEGLQSGQAKNLHEVMISVEKADISLKMLVQFRNKALQAYEEIMRMQI